MKVGTIKGCTVSGVYRSKYQIFVLRLIDEQFNCHSVEWLVRPYLWFYGRLRVIEHLSNKGILANRQFWFRTALKLTLGKVLYNQT